MCIYNLYNTVIHIHIYIYNHNAYLYYVILCNTCIVIIIFTNVMYFNLFIILLLTLCVYTPRILFLEIKQCQNKLYLYNKSTLWRHNSTHLCVMLMVSTWW